MNHLRHMMMQLAVLIVLLHSFVPHHHHQESTIAVDCISIDQKQSPDLLDLLGDLFHTDLGADHLENLQTSPTQKISLETPLEFEAITPLVSGLPAVGYHTFFAVETISKLCDGPASGPSIPRAPPHRV